ncbi:hypothetical protein CK203_072153 [Vitis vinifera]|uniref:Uncharacterized protein n=1 Tax=Vitis vinifera TaxID=29760 RepID=A0A438EXI3_VITVI|nr:hypothetical protein CK203_072153 [Vitis vinifera]
MEALRCHINSVPFLSPETLISSLSKHHIHPHSTLGYLAFSSSSLRSTLTRSTTLSAVSDLFCLLKALKFRGSAKWRKKSKNPFQLIMAEGGGISWVRPLTVAPPSEPGKPEKCPKIELFHVPGYCLMVSLFSGCCLLA